MRLIKANTSVDMHKLLSMLLSDFSSFSELFCKNVTILGWLKSLRFLHPKSKFRARLEQCSRLVRILFEVNIIYIYIIGKYFSSSSPFLLFRASILPLQIYQPITQLRPYNFPM